MGDFRDLTVAAELKHTFAANGDTLKINFRDLTVAAELKRRSADAVCRTNENISATSQSRPN